MHTRDTPQRTKQHAPHNQTAHANKQNKQNKHTQPPPPTTRDGRNRLCEMLASTIQISNNNPTPPPPTRRQQRWPGHLKPQTPQTTPPPHHHTGSRTGTMVRGLIPQNPNSVSASNPTPTPPRPHPHTELELAGSVARHSSGARGSVTRGDG
jgi:hypothetical protein